MLYQVDVITEIIKYSLIQNSISLAMTLDMVIVACTVGPYLDVIDVSSHMWLLIGANDMCMQLGQYTEPE